MLIDTHTHLDNEQYEEDVNEVLRRALENDVQKFIIPGTNQKCLQNALALSSANANVFFSVGFHPYDIDDFSMQSFVVNANNPKCVAIGECGLDYFRGDENKKEQQEIFTTHIQLAKEYKKPLIIHIRDAKDSQEASEDAKAILLANEASEVGGVLHCFNASETLLELANHNFYYGIGGVLSFKNAKELVEIVPKIPRDKLLLETDSPYLAPHPHRGKRNEPYYVRVVFEKMQEVLGVSEDELEPLLLENTKRLFPTIF